MTALRRPYDPCLDADAKRALAFMTQNGHPAYAEEVEMLTTLFEERQADAGPGGVHCPFVQEDLDKINDQIREAARAAVDRLEDWITDPLP